jgi:hypothetical protein
MGRGNGGFEPVQRLLDQFDPNDEVHTKLRGWSVLNEYTERYQRETSNVVFIDIMLNIENNRKMYSTTEKKYGPVERGSELSEKVSDVIQEPLKCKNVDTVVVCMDVVNELRNKTKEVTYYSRPPRRRNGVIPMKTVYRHVISNDHIPQGHRDKAKDKWASFKSNPIMRKQLNWYFFSEFIDKLALNIDKPGECHILLDNYIKEDQLFVEIEHTKNYLVKLKYNNGKRISVEYCEEFASYIGEGELALQYFSLNINKIMGKKYNTCYLQSVDQDIFINVNMGSRYRRNDDGTWKNRVVVVMKKKDYTEEIRKIRVDYQQKLKDLEKVKRKLSKNKSSLDYKKCIASIKKIKDLLRSHNKICYTNYYDMNKLYDNMEAYYRDIIPEKLDFMYIEGYLFQAGGCDFHDKPFHRIGYKTIVKNVVQNITRVVKMFRTVQLTVSVSTPLSDEDGIVKVRTLDIDPNEYKKFAAMVRKKKVKDINIHEEMVNPRNIMFTLLCIRFIPRILQKCGLSIMFNPYEFDGFWGYEKKIIPTGPPNTPVCIPLKILDIVHLNMGRDMK